MTISNTQSTVTAEGNGLTTQFGYTFLIPEADGVLVTLTDSTVTPPVTTTLTSLQYTITGIGSPAGGIVTYPLSGTALQSGFSITISRNVPIVQDTSISNQGNFYPAVVEGSLDYLTMICQDIERDLLALAAEVAALVISEIIIVPSMTNAVPTVAAMKAASVSPSIVGTIFYLEGYTSPADGGGGTFYLTNNNPGADNGGTIIWSSTSGYYYVRINVGASITPLMFGAKGDGSTDDNAALSAASAYLTSVGGGILDLQGKTYKVTSRPMVHTANVTVQNGTIDARGVANYSNGGRNCSSPIAASGSLSSILATMSRSTVRGQQEAIFATDPGLAIGDQVLIGQIPPTCVTTSQVNPTDTTIPVNSTTGFSTTGGLCWISEEEMTYATKDATNFYNVTRGRGTFNPGGKTIPMGTLLVEEHTGKVAMANVFPVSKAEYKTVSGIRALGSETVILFNEPIDDIYSPVCNGWIAKLTNVNNLKLSNITLINGDQNSNRTTSGLGECGPYYRYCNGLEVTDCTMYWGTMANIVLDSCFNYNIQGNYIYGKATADATGAFDWYGISLTNVCTSGIVQGNFVRDCFQHTTLWASSFVPSPAYWGSVRYLSWADNLFVNSGQPWRSQHYGFSTHGGDVEHITLSNNIIRGATVGYELQGGAHMTITGGEVSGWGRAAISFVNGFYIRNVKFKGINITDRWKGAGNTILVGGIDNVVTTLVLGYGLTYAFPSGSSIMCIKIDSEIIRLGSAQSDGVTFINCTRGWGRTTAASHSDGATVIPFGDSAALPVDISLGSTGFYKPSPDTNATYLPGAILSTDTSIPVADVSVFGTPVDSDHALVGVIQGTDSADRYQPEVFSYTGITPGSAPAGTLTGVIRALAGTPAKAHPQYAQIMQYTCGATSVEFDVAAQLDLDINSAIAFRDAVPTQDISVNGCKLRWTDPTHRATAPAIYSITHGITIKNCEIHNFAWGIDMAGNLLSALGNRVDVDVQDTIGSPGVFVRALTDHAVVMNNTITKTFYGIQVQAGATNARVLNNNVSVGRSDNVINDAGTATINRGNTPECPTPPTLLPDGGGNITVPLGCSFAYLDTNGGASENVVNVNFAVNTPNFVSVQFRGLSGSRTCQLTRDTGNIRLPTTTLSLTQATVAIMEQQGGSTVLVSSSTNS